MSNEKDTVREYLKTHNYVLNFTLRTRAGYPLDKIVDSLKGTEGIKIVSSKQIKEFTYDFIIDFQTKDVNVFNEKYDEMAKILKEDFKRTNMIAKNTFP